MELAPLPVLLIVVHERTPEPLVVITWPFVPSALGNVYALGTPIIVDHEIVPLPLVVKT